MGKIGDQFEELVGVIARLRDPNGGCPWDLKQTHQSLKPYLIEEAFEAIEAVDKGPKELADELGDVLLQVVLHAQVAADSKTFQVGDVVQNLTDKMIRRHPHVFSANSEAAKNVRTAEDVLKNWESIKAEERREPEKKTTSSSLDGLPKMLPALARAHVLGERANRVGFDWTSAPDVAAKVREEVAEFIAEVEKNPNSPEVREELGDLFFVLAQVGRKLEINAEHALTTANKKFERRFKTMEQLSPEPLSKLTPAEQEALWQEAKRQEK